MARTPRRPGGEASDRKKHGERNQSRRFAAQLDSLGLAQLDILPAVPLLEGHVLGAIDRVDCNNSMPNLTRPSTFKTLLAPAKSRASAMCQTATASAKGVLSLAAECWAEGRQRQSGNDEGRGAAAWDRASIWILSFWFRFTGSVPLVVAAGIPQRCRDELGFRCGSRSRSSPR